MDIGVFGELVKELVALVVELVGPKVWVVLDGAGVVQNRLVQLGDLLQLDVYLLDRNLQVVDLLVPGALQLGADLLEGLGQVLEGGEDDVGVGLRVGVGGKALEGVAMMLARSPVSVVGLYSLRADWMSRRMVVDWS